MKSSAILIFQSICYIQDWLYRTIKELRQEGKVFWYVGRICNLIFSNKTHFCTTNDSNISYCIFIVFANILTMHLMKIRLFTKYLLHGIRQFYIYEKAPLNKILFSYASWEPNYDNTIIIILMTYFSEGHFPHLRWYIFYSYKKFSGVINTSQCCRQRTILKSFMYPW